jgi:cytosine/adenosine deaminase-related metal-dependent hydrolase
VNETTIYCADWVLPVATPFLHRGAVAVDGRRIVAVAGADELRAAYPDAQLVDFGHAIIMPGFVNAHCHVEYTAFRGIMDDEEFGDWILQLVEVKASLTPEEYLISALLGALESISSGITTAADVTYTGSSLEALKRAGLRGIVYQEVFGVDDAHLDETLTDMHERLERLRREAPPQIAVGVAPHGTYTVSSRLYREIARHCREAGVKITSHVAESKEEVTYIRSGSGKFAHDFREKMGWERMLVQPYGVSPIKYLQQWDVFGPDFLAVHCVQASLDDIRILRQKGAAVAHCPKSNAKTGCGVAPLHDLLHQGVRVGLGTDSPASSNIMDMFDEMRVALFLHRAVERDVTVLDAERAVRIATLGGAEALGLADQIGSLDPGKLADLIAVDVSTSHFVPIDNPYSALVYGANQDDVFFTCVDGRVLYDGRRFTSLDEETIRDDALRVRRRLLSRVREGRVRVGAAESGWWQTTTDDKETS